jgi:hypothetical protein
MSGNTWYLVQDLVPWLLELFDASVAIDIQGISALTTKKITNDFETNDRPLKKKINADLALLSPLGKSDPNLFIPTDTTADLLILITDETNPIPLPDETPVVVLGFNPNQSVAKTLSLRSGFFLELFAVTTDIIQKTEISQKIRNIRDSVPATSADFLPRYINNFSEQGLDFFVQRNFVEKPTKTTAQSNQNWYFIRRSWARLKIAEILDRVYLSGVASINQVDDLLYLSRNYGVSTRWFHPDTQQATLKKTLDKTENINQIPYKNWHLRQPNLFQGNDQPKFFGATPVVFYEAENVWRTVDFYDRVRPDMLVKIAPFSAAQKKLLTDFPDIFAPIFSMGEQVDFCLEWKCFSVRENFRSDVQPRDRAFVLDFLDHPWATDYLVTIVNQNSIETDKNGNLDPEKF